MSLNIIPINLCHVKFDRKTYFPDSEHNAILTGNKGQDRFLYSSNHDL